MSREDGFDVADVATGHLDDPKVKALWRALAPDQDRMSRALLLHVAVLLASWRQGARVTVTEAVPVWLDPDETLVAALVGARLLDKGGRIPPHSWRGWFGPAWDRREKRRAAGALGGRPVKPKLNLSETTRLSTDNPDRPTGRSVRTVRQDRNGASSNDAKVGTLAAQYAAIVGKRP
jgi:hypothetical protein